VENAKRLMILYIPMIVADTCIYVAAFMNHLRVVELSAFLALFLSILFFVLSYRSIAVGKNFPIKFGVNFSSSVTMVAAFLCLILSGWRP
jgi:hypothetical protein